LLTIKRIVGYGKELTEGMYQLTHCAWHEGRLGT